VKIKKPEDEKYFKDIVLNDILEEISTETGAPKPSQLKQRKKHNNKLFSKILFYIIIGIVFFFFVMALSKLVTDATIEVEPAPNTESNTTVDTEDWKMPKDRVDAKKTSIPNVIELTPLHKVKVQKETVDVEVVEQKPMIKQKTQRELAKEALKQQMLK